MKNLFLLPYDDYVLDCALIYGVYAENLEEAQKEFMEYLYEENRNIFKKEKRVSTYEEFVFILNHTILAIGEIEEIQSGQYNYFIPYVEKLSETPKIFKTNADGDSHALRLYHGIGEVKDDYPVIYRIDEF
jgi:hypothetical protein